MMPYMLRDWIQSEKPGSAFAETGLSPHYTLVAPEGSGSARILPDHPTCTTSTALAAFRGLVEDLPSALQLLKRILDAVHVLLGRLQLELMEDEVGELPLSEPLVVGQLLEDSRLQVALFTTPGVEVFLEGLDRLLHIDRAVRTVDDILLEKRIRDHGFLSLF